MTEPAYGWRGRVGLIVPPANMTVEPEVADMLPKGVSLHATRLPGQVSEDTSIGLRERFEGYNRAWLRPLIRSAAPAYPRSVLA